MISEEQILFSISSRLKCQRCLRRMKYRKLLLSALKEVLVLVLEVLAVEGWKLGGEEGLLSKSERRSRDTRRKLRR